jgi:hypothetical protein
MVALKAQWVVSCGLIPGDVMMEYTRAWSYTSIDWQADGHKRGERWHAMSGEAHAYAVGLEDGGLNHVRVEFLWM